MLLASSLSTCLPAGRRWRKGRGEGNFQEASPDRVTVLFSTKRRIYERDNLFGSN
jgi:hypothetical protein